MLFHRYLELRPFDPIFQCIHLCSVIHHWRKFGENMILYSERGLGLIQRGPFTLSARPRPLTESLSRLSPAGLQAVCTSDTHYCALCVVNVGGVSVCPESCVRCSSCSENVASCVTVVRTSTSVVSSSVPASSSGSSVRQSSLQVCSVCHRCYLSSVFHAISHSLPRLFRDLPTSPGIIYT